MSRYRFTLVVLVLFFSAFSVTPALADNSSAPAEIPTGLWEGYFERYLNAYNDLGYDLYINATTTVTAPIVMQIAGDGSISGSMGPMEYSTTWESNVDGVGDTCTGTVDVEITGGTVTEGADHLPAFDLQVISSNPGYQCPFDLGQILAPTKASMKALTASAGKIAGERITFEPDFMDFAVNNLIQGGAQVTTNEYWELNAKAPLIDFTDVEYTEYFLEGISFDNTYQAMVDWNGQTPGIVTFDLAGQTVSVPGDTDVYADLDVGQAPAGAQQVQVMAFTSDGTPSAPESIPVQIVPLQPWAQDAGFHVLETYDDALWHHVRYTGTANVPSEPLELPYLDVSAIPVFGGKWGVPPIQLDVELFATSAGGVDQPGDVTGKVQLYLGGDAAALDVDHEGQATTNLTPTALLIDKAYIEFQPEPLALEKQLGIVDLVPGMGSLSGVPVVGDLIQALNSIASITARLTGALAGHADIGPNAAQSELTFTQGSLTPTSTVGVSAQFNLFGLAWAYVYGGGSGTFVIVVAPNSHLENCVVALQFGAGAGLQGVWQRNFSKDWTLFTCQSTSGGPSYLASPAPLPDLGPLTVAARPVGLSAEHAVSAVVPVAQGSQTILVEGVNAQTAPALAVSPDGPAALVWQAEDPDLERQQAAEIHLRLDGGSGWGDTLSLTADTNLDSGPAAAFDSSGNLVVAWVRSTTADLPADAELTEELARTYEIAYAVVDAETGEAGEPQLLTGDGVFDFGPQIARAGDGSLLLVWQSSPSTSLIGTAASPNQLNAARWDGSGWSDVKTVADDLVGTLYWRAAAYNQRTALVVADMDTDGDLATAGDREIAAYELSGQNWKAARYLTDDDVLDLGPLVTYSADGDPAVAWYHQGMAYGLSGDLEGAAQPLFDTMIPPSLGSGSLLAGADGEMLLVWAGLSGGQYDVLVAHRDPETGAWSAPEPLFGTDEQESQLSAALTPSGDLWIGLSLLAVEETQTTVEGIDLNLPQRPETADLAVFQAEGAVAPFNIGGRGFRLPALDDIPWVAILCGLGLLLGVAVIVIVVVVVVLRKRKKSGEAPAKADSRG